MTCSRRSHRSPILGPHSRGYNWCHERSKSNSQKRFTLVLAILLSSRYLWSRQWYRIWRPLNIKGLNKMQFGYAAKHKALQSCTYIATSTVMDFLTYISSLCFHSCACPKDTLLNQSPPQPGKRCKPESQSVLQLRVQTRLELTLCWYIPSPFVMLIHVILMLTCIF